MPTAWRIVKSRYAGSTFDGEGARLYGGRWNSPGTAVVYAAQHKSLAILEILVHVEKTSVLPAYSLVRASFEEDLIEALDRSGLPESWREYPASEELKAIGDRWVRERRSAVLALPSVIVEEESNYLINPGHPDSGAIRIGDPEPFEFDSRLLD